MRQLFFALLLGIWIVNPASGQLDGAMIQRIDSVFAHFTTGGSPGAALGVIRKGELAYAKGYGLANLEYDIPITPQTVFHMASVSKQFTAFAMLILEEQGQLTLDDEVRHYVPELADLDETITIRHLIHHTSGLRDQWNLLAMAGWRLDDVITLDQVMKLVDRQEALNFPPGDRYTYCNTGYTLMAEIVRKVTGMSFGDWMEEYVFEPLGMEHTLFYEDHERIVPNRAYSYAPDGDGFKKSVLSYANAGATSLFTTVEDMARWAANFRNPKVGGPEMIARSEQRGILNNGDTINYAFGQTVDAYKGLRRVSHGGADAGYRTFFARFPDTDYDFVVLTNVANGNPGGLAMQVADIVLEDHFPVQEGAEGSLQPATADRPGERQPIRMTARRLRDFTGTYFFKDVGISMETSVKNDSLYLKQLWDGTEYAIVPFSDTTFLIPADPNVTFTFQDFEEGTPLAVKVTQGPASFRGERVAVSELIDPAAYAGSYYSKELDTTYYLEADGDGLKVTHQRHPDFEIKLQRKDEGIGNQWFFGSVQFQRDAQGAVSGMKVSSGRVMDLWFERKE